MAQDSEVDKQTVWSELSYDVAELIFSRLPEVTICRAASVCKSWYSVIRRPAFCEFYKRNRYANSCSPFVYMVDGVNYTFAERCDGRRGFLLQPAQDRHDVPTFPCPEDGDIPTTEAAGGLHLAYTGSNQTILRYKLSLVEKDWRTTPAMPYYVQDPIVGVVEGTVDDTGHKLIIAGGLSNYAEAKEELTVTIYDEKTNSWGLCEPLPAEFRGCASALCMSAVVCKGTLFVYEINSGLVTWLNINSKRWSPVLALRPSRKVSELFLVSQSASLCLVGVQGSSERDVKFTVWSVVDEFEKTMRVGEVIYSTVLSKSCAPPPSTIKRWASSVTEISSGLSGELMILLIHFLIEFCKAYNMVYYYLRDALNSTSTTRRKQEPVVVSGL